MWRWRTSCLWTTRFDRQLKLKDGPWFHVSDVTFAGSQRRLPLLAASSAPNPSAVVAATAARAGSVHHPARVERRHRLLLVPPPVQQGNATHARISLLLIWLARFLRLTNPDSRHLKSAVSYFALDIIMRSIRAKCVLIRVVFAPFTSSPTKSYI